MASAAGHSTGWLRPRHEQHSIPQTMPNLGLVGHHPGSNSKHSRAGNRRSDERFRQIEQGQDLQKESFFRKCPVVPTPPRGKGSAPLEMTTLATETATNPLAVDTEAPAIPPQAQTANAAAPVFENEALPTAADSGAAYSQAAAGPRARYLVPVTRLQVAFGTACCTMIYIYR